MIATALARQAAARAAAPLVFKRDPDLPISRARAIMQALRENKCSSLPAIPVRQEHAVPQYCSSTAGA